jgi:hypothetical protein
MSDQIERETVIRILRQEAWRQRSLALRLARGGYPNGLKALALELDVMADRLESDPAALKP